MRNARPRILGAIAKLRARPKLIDGFSKRFGPFAEDIAFFHAFLFLFTVDAKFGGGAGRRASQS